MAETYKILLVDDEEFVRKVIRSMLEALDFDVVEAVNGLDGLDVFSREKPDLVFTDLQMPVMDGLSFIARLKEQSPATPIVVVSGTGNIQSAIEAIRVGAWDYVTKPIEALECLHIAAHRVLERASLISENRAYQEHLEDLVIQRTEELHDSEVRFRTLFETASDAIVLMQDEKVISCNLKTGEIFGCPRDQIIGRTLLSFSPICQPGGEKSENVLRERMKMALSGTSQFYEWRYLHSSGSLFDAEISLNMLQLRGSLYLQAIMRDITERKKSQQALLDNIRIKRELEMAQEIQKSLLPDSPPEMPGIVVACRCIPALVVGGDYYDFFTVDDTTIDAVIADVAGHNFGSALLMTVTRSVLHAMVNKEHQPGSLVSAVNGLLYRDLSRAELQISMFYMRFDAATCQLSYANAGHTRPLLFHSGDGSFEELDADGMLLGIREDVYFEEKTMGLAAGDLLLLHTDGVSEAENASGEFFGIQRMAEVVRGHYSSRPEDIISELMRQVTVFTGVSAMNDDVSLAVIKIVPRQG